MYRNKIMCLLLPLAFLAAVFSGCAAPDTLTLSGTAECTEYDVHAEAAGMIVAIKAAEGAAVSEGDVLASVDSSVQQTSVQQAEALVQAKQAQLDSIKSGSREEQIASAKAALDAAQAKYNDLKNGATAEQIRQARASANLAATNESSAKTAYSNAKGAYNDALAAYTAGLIPKDKLNEAKFAMDEANGKYKAAAQQYDVAYAQYQGVKKGPTKETLKAAKAGVDQAQAQLDLAKNGSTQYSIDAAQADLNAAKAQLDQAKLLLGRNDVKAPVSGVLTMLGVEKGDMLNTGGYAATISDLSDIWANVYIPQSKLKFVSLGQTVSLSTPAWPAQAFAGTVTYIASEAEFTPKNVETHEAKENTVFKVKIKIEDNGKKIKPGMTIDAQIPAKQG
jgi:HlyD family secretion protein